MIKKFKVGYWYKYIKEKPNNDEFWTPEMKKMLDGKWRKCIHSGHHFLDEDLFANFEGISNKNDNNFEYWFWKYPENFIESKFNPNIKRKLKKILDKK